MTLTGLPSLTTCCLTAHVCFTGATQMLSKRTKPCWLPMICAAVLVFRSWTKHGIGLFCSNTPRMRSRRCFSIKKLRIQSFWHLTSESLPKNTGNTGGASQVLNERSAEQSGKLASKERNEQTSSKERWTQRNRVKHKNKTTVPNPGNKRSALDVTIKRFKPTVWLRSDSRNKRTNNQL